MELSAERSNPARAAHMDRVLVFSVDDGLFGIHLDWVEAVYEAASMEAHRVRIDKGPWHRFLLHRGGPALQVDLREAFDLTEVTGMPERAAWAVIQSGGYKLAVAIDQVAGVQDLDLERRAPIPANLVRDGGIPVGHIVQMDERMLVVLDPHRLLSGMQRDALESVWNRAVAYAERHRRMQEVWSEICAEPNGENLRVYARLCARNARPRAAAAARSVLKLLANLESGIRHGELGGSFADRLAAELLLRSGGGANGVVEVRGPHGEAAGAVFIAAGRAIDARCGSEWGRMALRRLLAMADGSVAYAQRDLGQHPERVAESTAALLISSLEEAAAEQRKRRGR